MEENNSGAVQRRTVLTAGAWAVPAIAVATALPAASASQGDALSIWMSFACYSDGLGFHIAADRFAPVPAGTTLTVFGGDGDTSFGYLQGSTTTPFAGNSYVLVQEIPAGGFATILTYNRGIYSGDVEATITLPPGWAATGATLSSTQNIGWCNV